MANKFSGWHACTRMLERVFVATNGMSDVCFLGARFKSIPISNTFDRFTISGFRAPIQFGWLPMSVATD
jgi:hypothetical protein